MRCKKHVKSNNNRPIFLNLLRIRLPLGAVVSIVHRATGLVLLLAVPVVLYLLERSLRGPEDYRWVLSILETLPARVLGVIGLWAGAQHFFSGVRHLLQDADIGVELDRARLSAWLVWAASLSVVAIAAVGLSG